MKNIFFTFLGLLFISNGASAQLKAINYTDGNQKLNGLSITPKKGSKTKPGVLILPAWKGIDAHSKQSAEKLSKMGYYAFVADIYGEGNYPTNTQEAAKQSGFYKNNVAIYQRRIQLALDQLVKAGANPDNIVVIGHCFGGTGVLEAARAGMKIQGAVSFHGGLGRDATRVNNPITAKILALHGADDPYVPVAEISSFQQEMRDSKADWEMVYYANAVHAFTEIEAGNDNSKGAAYNEKAAKRSWERMNSFLEEVLK
ncbi:dienelactone hydrolase family protein [Flavobacterium glaciei]|uniref:Dienelactone hydrolase n=1 Tax=Flavobacterium glaciei TaxID=386300 RepID=A0A562PJM0_9FLAO|nr:dienelactone hydrolase family protein [Flavobacterium glaciei]RDI49541.1 dienelactone hydrolase [Flavobacterium glaciei]TWI44206.1 dienelactone hydrolase [Flavobacterium glaciei]